MQATLLKCFIERFSYGIEHLLFFFQIVTVLFSFSDPHSAVLSLLENVSVLYSSFTASNSSLAA